MYRCHINSIRVDFSVEGFTDDMRGGSFAEHNYYLEDWASIVEFSIDLTSA